MWTQIPVFRLQSRVALWKMKQALSLFVLASFPFLPIGSYPFHHWETFLSLSPSTPDPRFRVKRKKQAAVLKKKLKKYPEWEKANLYKPLNKNFTVCQYENCREKTSSANQSECIWKLKAEARARASKVTAVWNQLQLETLVSSLRHLG